MNIPHSLLLLVTLVWLAGCIGGNPTKPSEFYVLSAQPGTPVNNSLAEDAISIGLGPLILPETYDRPQIVTRSEDNRITLAEFNRWGGDLDKELGRTLIYNLMSRLNTDRIVPYPWSRRYDPEFQVTVRLIRFDGVLGENAFMEGIWRVLDADKGCELAADRFSLVTETGGPGYPALVSAMSRTVADLSQIIAERVAVLKPGCHD